MYSQVFKVIVSVVCGLNIAVSAISLFTGVVVALFPISINALAIYGVVQSKAWSTKYLCLFALIIVLSPVFLLLRLFFGDAEAQLTLEVLYRCLLVIFAVYILATTVPLLVAQSESAYRILHEKDE